MNASIIASFNQTSAGDEQAEIDAKEPLLAGTSGQRGTSAFGSSNADISETTDRSSRAM
jgi:hypothetical protein